MDVSNCNLITVIIIDRTVPLNNFGVKYHSKMVWSYGKDRRAVVAVLGSTFG